MPEKPLNVVEAFTPFSIDEVRRLERYAARTRELFDCPFMQPTNLGFSISGDTEQGTVTTALSGVDERMNGPMASARQAAGELLESAGQPAPSAPPRPLDKGNRLSYRYPTHSIPGAPTRDPVRQLESAAGKRIEKLGRELGVISLRVWLAGLSPNSARVRCAYIDWRQSGSGWTAASWFDKNNRGGFSKFKDAATNANSRVRAVGGDPLTDAHARTKPIRAELEALKSAYTQSGVAPVVVDFGEAVRTVLAGPTEDALPPKQ